MIIHSLEIRKEFADAILIGDKTFEVRENNRGFQRGDYIRFTATDKYATEIPYHEINQKNYVITYVLSGWGIEPGKVVFSIKEAKYGTVSCAGCQTWFPKEREPYLQWCGHCGAKMDLEKDT